MGMAGAGGVDGRREREVIECVCIVSERRELAAGQARDRG